MYKNIDDYYEDFLDNLRKTDFYIENNLQDKIDSFDYDNYLSAFPFYTNNDKLYRYIRDRLLNPNQYDNIILSMMREKNYNIKEIEKHLYLSYEDIKNLHLDDNIIGLHSHTHPTIMDTYDFDKQRDEYSTNNQILSQIINDEVYTCSYPCNSYNEDTIKIMKMMDIKLSFRANMEKAMFPY